jgi:hypothetical protein
VRHRLLVLVDLLPNIAFVPHATQAAAHRPHPHHTQRCHTNNTTSTTSSLTCTAQHGICSGNTCVCVRFVSSQATATQP